MFGNQKYPLRFMAIALKCPGRFSQNIKHIIHLKALWIHSARMYLTVASNTLAPMQAWFMTSTLSNIWDHNRENNL